MSQQPKRASENLLHILKSVMDVKARKLRRTIGDAATASTEQPILLEHMSNTRDFIARNRIYDPSETNEAEAQLADMEDQASGIQAKIDAGRVAETEMLYIDKFNKTYHKAVIAPRIQELERLAYDTANMLSEFSIKLDTCQYFQDCEIDEYGDYDELEQKKAYYADRIAAYQQELNDYEHQIRLLQNIR